jgi:uncharacterized protein (TIGR03067 family)
MWPVACAVGLSLTFLPTGARADDKGADLKRLQGTWKVVSGEKGGGKDLDLAKAKVVIKGDTFTLKEGKKKDESVSIRLRPAETPKQLDFVFKEGGKEVVVMGIYSLEADTLKLCWDKESRRNGRPTAFATKKDSDQVLVVCRREKKE